MIKKNINLITLFFAALFSLNNLFGQKQILFSSQVIDEIFSKNHLAFTAKGVLFEKGKIIGENIPFSPNANSRLGFEAGVDYLINKNKNTSLNTGFHIGFAPRNFTFIAPKNYVQPFYNDDYVMNGGLSNISPLFYASIPLTFEKRIFRKNNFFYYGGGVNLKYALMFSEDEEGYFLDARRTRIAVMTENWKTNFNVFVQANASIGYGFILKNKNLFKVGLCSNIALSNVSTANYTFTPPTGTNQDGLYVTRAGFIGLSFSYVLTNF